MLNDNFIVVWKKILRVQTVNLSSCQERGEEEEEKILSIDLGIEVIKKPSDRLIAP